MEAATPQLTIAGVRRGRVVALDEAGKVFVSVEGIGSAVAALLGTKIDERTLRTALDTRQDVFMLFEDGDPARPVIVGIAQGTAVAQAVSPLLVEADADGRRVKVVAKDELVFQCGKASITIRRNGKVIVRGTDIETRAEGTNRVRGGQVRIN